ncbi:MAG: hypothetical protein Q4F05_11235 [bacterium]|nr:hypothetical protein [bacterium]
MSETSTVTPRTTQATGVMPTNKVTFGICTAGRKEADTASTIQTVVVKDAESLNISFDNGIEEWNPMDQEGWVRRLMTSKSIGVSLGGKRNYGDPGNDYVASLGYANGQDANSWFSINFPNGDKLMIPVVVNVTSMGGDSTSVNALEWEVQSDGKPSYTPAASA